MLKVRHQIGFLVVLVFTAVLLFACGGGGGGGGDDGSSNPDPVEPVIPKQVMGSITSGRIVSTMVSQLAQKISPIRSSKNSTNTERQAGSVNDQGACTISGTNSVNMTWQGPDAQTISNCDDVSDLSVTLTLDECVQQDKPQMEQSMTLSLFKDGSLCQPDTMNADVSNLHIIDTDDVDLDFRSDSLQIDITEITYSYNNDFMVHANVALTGDVRGTRNDTQYAAQFNNFVQIVDTDDNHNFTTTFSGQIKSDCMKQWAEIKTTTPIQFKDQDCPTHGAIEITVNGESTTVEYQSDGSVLVGDKTYDSCQQLEGACND